MKKRVLLWGVIILIILTGLRALLREKNVPITENETIIPVSVLKIEKSGIQDTISVSGNISAWAEVTIYPEVTGRAEKVLVKEGQLVKQGDLLIQIDYEKTALTVKQIESQLESAKINLQRIEKDYERMKRLYEQKVVAEKTLEDAKTALDTTTYNVEALESQLDLAKVRLRDSNITAPIRGVITKKFIDQGELVSGPLVTIADINKVKAILPIREMDIAKIKKGQKADIKLDAHPEKVFRGEVYNIFPELDIRTRSAQVEIILDNPAHTIKPGMFLRADIILASRENAFVIPVDSILTKEGAQYVFVADKEHAKIREITTGLEKEEQIEVLSGLQEEDLLIIEGQRTVEDGSKISII